MLKLFLFEEPENLMPGQSFEMKSLNIGVSIKYPIVDIAHFNEFLRNQMEYYQNIQDIHLEKQVDDLFKK